jgi:hypothetical protein
MIPAPLAVPVDVRPRPARQRSRTLAWAALVALVAAVVGAVVWAGAYAPFGYQRFDVFDATREMTFRSGGTYVVYEEFDGASQALLPTPIEIVVVDADGVPVPVTSLLDPGERAAPDAYDTPWHEGRAIARFEIDEGGTYVVQVAFLPGETGRFRPFEQVTLAVGRAPALSWMAGPLGALALAGVPLVVAVGLAVAARRADRPCPGDRVGAGSVPGAGPRRGPAA